ncbi:hypothetical protein D3C73_1606510 [compost metagenome]
MHLLEEHQVGAGGAHRLAQFGEDEAPVEQGEALVDVDRQHLQRTLRQGGAGGADGFAALADPVRAAHEASFDH